MYRIILFIHSKNQPFIKSIHKASISLIYAQNSVALPAI